MHRIYLDWNIISYTKQKDLHGETFDKIFALVTRNKDTLLFPYSPAHLQDLKRSFVKSEAAKLETYNDLDFLQEVSRNYCLIEDYQYKRIIPSIRVPKEYFDELIQDTTLEDFDLDTLTALFDENNESHEEARKIWESALNILKSLPSGIDLRQLDNLPKQYQKIKGMFRNIYVENNFYNLLKDVIATFKSPNEFADIYKSIRNSAVQDLKINTDSHSWANAFEYLDKIFQKGNLNQSFRDLLASSSSDSVKTKVKSRFEHFSNLYISLDTFGYHRDKEVMNLIDDSTHAYYGAYCDYFVTNDNRTYYKTKAVYQELNIGTIVCKAEELPEELKKIGLEESDNGLLDFLKNLSNSTNIPERLLEDVDDNSNPIIVYKIDKPVVHYFNRMQITYLNDNTIFSFYKKRNNYSGFVFWKELETVLSKIISELGQDQEGKNKFNEQLESDEFLKSEWQGRIWVFENLIFRLFYDNPSFGLVLQVEFFSLST